MLILHHRLLSPAPDASRREMRAAGSTTAHALLGDILQGLGLCHTPLAKNAHGRPYLASRPDVDFNLSHTTTLAVCAFLQDGKITPRVGVDAEERTAYSIAKISAFSERFFGEQERRYVQDATDRRTAFTRVFVRKEAYAKYCGEGLGAHLSGTDTLLPDFEERHNVRFLAYRAGNVFVALCLPRTCTEAPHTTLCEDEL